VRTPNEKSWSKLTSRIIGPDDAMSAKGLRCPHYAQKRTSALQKEAATEAASRFLPEGRDTAIKLPQLNVVAVDELLGANFRGLVIRAYEVNAVDYVTVFFEEVGAVFAHYFGACRPGEESHCSM
jgi:hypothetical protein